VEQQLVAAVSILFPARELVVDGQTDTLLEAVARVRGVAKRVAGHLQAQRHVKVLGHVRLGPVLLVAVFVGEGGRVLERFPAEDGVVPDKGAGVARGHGEGDARVDEAGEPGDAAEVSILFQGQKQQQG
jgi:hypothetical protein